MAPFNLSPSFAGISVKLQPGVLLNICDAYTRRNEGQLRVIGTLLGYVSDGVVFVQNCYAVPHNEQNDQVRFFFLLLVRQYSGTLSASAVLADTLHVINQVSVDIPHHRTLYDLHHRVNSKEAIVGWSAPDSPCLNTTSS